MHPSPHFADQELLLSLVLQGQVFGLSINMILTSVNLTCLRSSCVFISLFIPPFAKLYEKRKQELVCYRTKKYTCIVCYVAEYLQVFVDLVDGA